MSIVANVHDVVVYDPKAPIKALDGQRLSKHSWKTDKETGVKRDSKAVSIPKITADMVAAQSIALAPHFAQYLMEVQDKMIKGMLEQNAGMSHVNAVDIGMTAILEYLEDSGESGRLTKESIGSWFDATVADTLMLTLAEKLGVSEVPSDAESKKIEAMVAEFRGKTCGLAGGKTRYSDAIATSVIKCMKLVEGDTLADKFVEKLEKMIAMNKVESVDLLSAL